APGLAWRGDFPALDLELTPPEGTPARASWRAGEVLRWIRIPRVLSYWSAFGPLDLERATRARGLGIVEHAWGAATRLDVTRLAPRRWQWDVLRLGDASFAAGLALGAPWSRSGPLRGPHGGLCVAPRGLERVRGVRIDVHDWTLSDA